MQIWNYPFLRRRHSSMEDIVVSGLVPKIGGGYLGILTFNTYLIITRVTQLKHMAFNYWNGGQLTWFTWWTE